MRLQHVPVDLCSEAEIRLGNRPSAQGGKADTSERLGRLGCFDGTESTTFEIEDSEGRPPEIAVFSAEGA